MKVYLRSQALAACNSSQLYLNLTDISTFTCESSTSPQLPIQWPYGVINPFEAGSNHVNAVQYAQSTLSPVESGRTSPDTLLEQLHQRTKAVEPSQIGLQVTGLSHHSTSSINSGHVALPHGAQRSKQLMQPGGPLPPTTASVEPSHAELPGKAHTSIDVVEQPPCLTTGDDVPIVIPSTLSLTLPSQLHDGLILSGCDHRTFQNQNQRHKRIELHAASERAAQRIREADKEIERLRGENMILRNQLHDNVRVRVTQHLCLSFAN